MASTSKGIVYPTSGDNIAPLETHFSALASSVNTALISIDEDITEQGTEIETLQTAIGNIQKGRFSSITGPQYRNSPKYVGVIPFSSRFDGVPVVTASVSSTLATTSGYVVTVFAVTDLQFQARIWKINDTVEVETLTLNWIATY
jgi:hypothetical protein